MLDLTTEYYIIRARGGSAVECRTTNAEGRGSNPGTHVRAPANPAVNGYLGQHTVKAVGRDASHITPFLTEATETGVCSTTPALYASHA